MLRLKTSVQDALLSALIINVSFIIVICLQRIADIQRLAPMIFVMAVFLISLTTHGYFWGMISSLISVLAVNFAFTFPYFEFNFIGLENLFSAIVMLFVSITTSTLTTNLKKQERMRAENEKEKLRANLLRAVSHDLRTPLTSIYGSCSTIADNYDSLDKEQQLKLLKEVCNDAQWLNRMVENLLSVTRIDNGTVIVRKMPTVLEELIDAVLVKFKKYYPSQQVIVEIPDLFIIIPMDSMLIEQVLINLLENAVHHAHGMTQLKLKVSVNSSKVIFEVIDDGCGITEENRTYANTPISPDSTRHGMGIGLSVCAAIIKAHGGKLETESKKGKGTTFRFALECEVSNHEQQ